eukprot:m.167863 g.167863  ORF g.167863 m.167863 type:complete len:493 (+) comp14467_c1_seq6:3611-5089(+)
MGNQGSTPGAFHRQNDRAYIEGFEGTLEDHEKQEVEEVVTHMMDDAVVLEKIISPILQGLAKECSGYLSDFQHRLKKHKSLKRKVLATVTSYQRELLSFRTGEVQAMTFEQVARSRIPDALRYTMVLPLKSYTANVRMCMSKLKEKGLKLVYSNNYWAQGDHYQGLNMGFAMGDNTFELQFHTEQGLQYKHKCHKLYVKFRVEKDPFRKAELFAKGCMLANKVHTPEDVLELEEVIRLPPPDPIGLLIDDLLLRAKRVEPTITPIVREAAGKQFAEPMDGSFLSSEELVHAAVLALLSSQTKALTIQQAVEEISNALVYDIVSDSESYVHTLKQCHDHLVGAGYSCVGITSFWQLGDAYQGLHAAYLCKEHKLRFQLRLHTTESWRLLSQEMLDWFQTYRSTPDLAQREKLYQVELTQSLIYVYHHNPCIHYPPLSKTTPMYPCAKHRSLLKCHHCVFICPQAILSRLFLPLKASSSCVLVWCIICTTVTYL